MYPKLFLITFLTCGLSLAGYSEAYSQAKSNELAKAPADEPPVLSVPEGYKYNGRGRRDPFVNPVPKPITKPAASPAPPRQRPPGLKGVLVSEAVVAGVVTSREPSMTVVVITAPGGK